jgi:hypothetical protein
MAAADFPVPWWGAFMTVAESLALLERLLDEAPLTPAGVWEAFREWACRPVACDRDALEASVGYDGETAWIEFRRALEDAGADRGEEVVLALWSARPDAPRFAEAAERCEDRGELAAFFARVEELPGFRLGLAYPHWELALERA